MSDQGTNFKHEVISALKQALGAHHHFATPQYPWANCTVEVVMREVLRSVRSLLSEWRLPVSDWPNVIKLIRFVLNHSPFGSMGDVAAITAMTGLPAMNFLNPLVTPAAREIVRLEDRKAIRGVSFENYVLHW